MSDAEIWKPVPSKPGIMASSWGRIQLPPSSAPMPYGGVRQYTTKPLLGVIRSARKGDKHVFRAIFNRKFGNIRVHQAVCEAFHGPKPDWATDVLHADEDGLNNRPENLSWGTRKQNLNAPGHLAYCASVCRAKMAGKKVSNRAR